MASGPTLHRTIHHHAISVPRQAILHTAQLAAASHNRHHTHCAGQFDVLSSGLYKSAVRGPPSALVHVCDVVEVSHVHKYEQSVCLLVRAVCDIACVQLFANKLARETKEPAVEHNPTNGQSKSSVERQTRPAIQGADDTVDVGDVFSSAHCGAALRVANVVHAQNAAHWSFVGHIDHEVFDRARDVKF